MTLVLLLLLCGLAGFILYLSDLVQAVIVLAVFSLFASLLFYHLHAPDVAIAEAAVGAGVSTVVFIHVIRRTRKERQW